MFSATDVDEQVARQPIERISHCLLPWFASPTHVARRYREGKAHWRLDAVGGAGEEGQQDR